MDGFEIIYFDLSSPDGFSLFQKKRNEFLDLMEVCYGEKYFGNDIYTDKLNQHNLTIYLAIDNAKIIGTLLIKDKIKLSGLAVLKKYRRKNIATHLIKTAKENHNYLYAEVAITSFHIQELFHKLNFKAVNKRHTILSLLSKQNDKITFIHRSKQYLGYVHTQNKYLIDQHKVFMIFEYKT